MGKRSKVEAIEAERTVATRELAVPKYETDPGPVKNRKCRDIPCFVLFIIFWAGLVGIGAYSFMNGDVNRLKFGVESSGNMCGVINRDPTGVTPEVDLTTTPYLYYFHPGQKGTYMECVDACPTATFAAPDYHVVCKGTRKVQRLQDVISGGESMSGDPSTWNIASLKNGDCVPAVSSSKMLHRCIPDVSDAADLLVASGVANDSALGDAAEIISDLNSRALSSQVLEAITDSAWIIAACTGVALAVSFVWLFLIQFIGPVIVWTCVFGSLAASWGCAGFLGYNFYLLKFPDTTRQALSTTSATLDSYIANENTLLACLIVASILAVILFCLVCFARRRIALAIRIINEASRAVRAMPFIVFFPIVKYVGIVAMLAFFIPVLALFVSSQEAIIASLKADAGNLHESLSSIAAFSDKTISIVLEIYLILGLFWTWNFVIAVGQCTVGGAVASWYWTRDKKQLENHAVIKAFFRTLRYHLGSLALGSFLIALLQLVRYLVLKLQHQIRHSQNRTAIALLACLQCCLACVEKVVKVLNKNAYIMIAVYGKSFFTSAKQAFNLLVRNAARLIVIDGVASFLLFLGKVMIASATTAIGLLLMQQYGLTDEGRMYVVPLVLIFISSWIIASAFMGVYDLAVDTIFLSFCEDCERHRESGNYYASAKLMAFMDKNQHALAVGDSSTEKK